jgi:type IV secretory pathway VirB4 component
MKTIQNLGFSCRTETINAVEAWRGSLPGDGYSNVRRVLLHTLNLADMLPTTSVWAGLRENPSALMPKHSPPLVFAATSGATPFRVNLHVSDLGHTMNERELEILQVSIPKQHYYVVSLLGRRLALRAAGLQGQQLTSEQAVESSLKSMAQSADGRMEALQVLADINDQQVQQLMKLRAIMLADMSSKQAYQATMIQQQATSQAATEWFFTTGPVTSDGKSYLPGSR